RDAIEQAAREGREVRNLDAEMSEAKALSEAKPRPAPSASPGAVASAATALAAGPSGQPAAAGPPSPTGAQAPSRLARIDSHYTSRSSVVRVEFSQLDHLLNLVGELIIHRTKLQEMGKELAEMPAVREGARDLLNAVHQVASVSVQLQETVM